MNSSKRGIIKQNILVTGGAGFIGSHIVEEGIKRGHRVVVMDNLSSGKVENLAHIDQTQLRIHKEDIRDIEFVNHLFKKESFDIVFHEAAIASVQKSISEPDYTYSVNVEGANNIFKAASKNNVRRVVFASSAAVYGDNPDLPKAEEMVATPVSPYGEHKLMNEKSAFEFSQKGTTKFTALRYFNVYGERQDPKSEYSGVISIFLDKISKHQSITIFGDGQQTRDFVYVKDIVTANYMAANNDQHLFSVYNVGTEIPTSLRTLAEVIHDVYKSSYKILYDKERLGDIKYSYSCIKKIRLIGYSPEYTIDQGIACVSTTH
ncbi:MAG: hypothetical protein A2Y40_10745 [Candidatus Margulisbacteria bacterium GWF2_35_9]|nr:MAG: hypothetical protein A2Y40_10745 [Candidatus Margulisbacteria bacterium GWF2_35_9]